MSLIDCLYTRLRSNTLFSVRRDLYQIVQGQRARSVCVPDADLHAFAGAGDIVHREVVRVDGRSRLRVRDQRFSHDVLTGINIDASAAPCGRITTQTKLQEGVVREV